MLFSQETKARIFVKSARICSLCFKQCGTNIEAAHIVSEADGGSNDDDNAIPLCFDCHQEIGAYDNRHPRGNRFTAAELRNRREQLYRLVESGTLQAQIIAERLKNATSAGSSTRLEEATSAQGPSAEGKVLVAEALRGSSRAESLSRKLALLSATDRAYVVDSLVSSFNEPAALNSLLAILATAPDETEDLLILERLIRQVTLTGTTPSKAQMMNSVPVELLVQADETLRSAFFLDVLEIMERDQFEEVNKITPAVPSVQGAIPEALWGQYFLALCDQAVSNAYQGAPAARRALKSLPDAMIRAGFGALNDEELIHRQNERLKEVIRSNESLWPKGKKKLFRAYTSQDYIEFLKTYYLAKR